MSELRIAGYKLDGGLGFANPATTLARTAELTDMVRHIDPRIADLEGAALARAAGDPNALNTLQALGMNIPNWSMAPWPVSINPLPVVSVPIAPAPAGEGSGNIFISFLAQALSNALNAAESAPEQAQTNHPGRGRCDKSRHPGSNNHPGKGMGGPRGC